MVNNKNTMKINLYYTLDDGFGRPKAVDYLRRRCTWNIQISPLAKITKLNACELSVSIYLSMLRTKRNLVRGDFD